MIQDASQGDNRSAAHHKVVAVIASLGQNLKRLQAAIDSVRLHTSGREYHLVLVDNSEDGVLANTDGVDEILHFGLNLGWVGSLEAIRRRYVFDYLWTIQDDMEIENDVLSYLRGDLERNPDLAVSCPVVIDEGFVPTNSAGAVWEDEKSLVWSSFPVKPTPPTLMETPSNICAVYGTGALWRKTALDAAGGFSLNLYPVIFVDVDMCLRLQKRGWKLRISKEAHVRHEGGGSTNRLLSRVLYSRNRTLLAKNQQAHRKAASKALLQVDEEVLFQIAAKSSYLLSSTSQLGDVQLKALKDRLKKIQSNPWLHALESSSLYVWAYENYVKFINSQSPSVRRILGRIVDWLKRGLRIS